MCMDVKAFGKMSSSVEMLGVNDLMSELSLNPVGDVRLSVSNPFQVTVLILMTHYQNPLSLALDQCGNQWTVGVLEGDKLLKACLFVCLFFTPSLPFLSLSIPLHSYKDGRST